MVDNLGHTIKKYRKLKKLTQKELSKLVGISERTLQNYENEETIPTVETLYKISDALDIEYSVLLDTEEGGYASDFESSKNIEPSKWKPEFYEKLTEKFFIGYLNNLISSSANETIKNAGFTEKDYKILMKYCNSSILNILELYYNSNPLVLDLKENKNNKDDNCD